MPVTVERKERLGLSFPLCLRCALGLHMPLRSSFYKLEKHNGCDKAVTWIGQVSVSSLSIPRAPPDFSKFCSSRRRPSLTFIERAVALFEIFVDFKVTLDPFLTASSCYSYLFYMILWHKHEDFPWLSRQAAYFKSLSKAAIFFVLHFVHHVLVWYLTVIHFNQISLKRNSLFLCVKHFTFYKPSQHSYNLYYLKWQH